MGGLTGEQIAFYRDEGYLLIDECLPPEAYQPLVDEFDAVIGQKAREAFALGQSRFVRAASRGCRVDSAQDNTSLVSQCVRSHSLESGYSI